MLSPSTLDFRFPASLLLLLGLALLPLPAEAADTTTPLTGRLTLVWGDSHGRDGESTVHRKVFLTDDRGESTELSVSDALLAGGVFRWNGRSVSVFPRAGADLRAGEPLPVAALRLEGGDEAELGGVSGSQPWISLPCKFSDLADEPEDLAFFQGMYANVPGGLDHYWREVSFNTIDIVGSTAIDWITLPGTQLSYVPTPGSGTNANLNAVFEDCTAAADSIVDFSNGGTPFAGINIMLNGLLDCCAWGGGRFATLDGVSKVWRTTWDPPWAFANEGVIAHEMGHGFGLPHANNFDNDGNPYDSPWDVMSSATGFAVNDPTYGALGKHVNAYHKDQLDWFPPARRFEPAADSSTQIQLDHTALADSTHYQIARIPIDGSRWYTVEARQRTGDYELSLPGDAVIIHQVDTGRSEPSWAVDSDVPPANYGSNPGTMWTVGETFADEAEQIWVTVDSQTPTGFVITVSTGSFGEVFTDGFENGNLTSWTDSVP